MRVPVGNRLADGAVGGNADKIYSPRVNADRGDVQITLLCGLQTFDNLKIESIDVPIEVSVHLNEIVWETCQLLQFNLAIIKASHDCTSARGS